MNARRTMTAKVEPMTDILNQTGASRGTEICGSHRPSEERNAMTNAMETTIPISHQPIPGFVSILMVNWNDGKFLNGCLASIRQKVTVPYEIILLDNASHDDSVSFVEREYPDVKIVRSPENVGFIRGTNEAAKHARGEFYLMLNPDTILRTDIAPAIRLMEADSTVGAVGASMYDGKGEPAPSCGNYPTLPRLLLIKSLLWKPHRGAWGPPAFGAKRVEWITGAWLLTRASAWKQIGGLDDRLLFYGDDLHYCRSLQEAGLVSVHMPSLAFTHFVGYSSMRQPYLYTAFRWFHTKYSGRARRWLAAGVMKSGLYLRVGVYGILARLSRNPKYQDSWSSARRVLSVWDQTKTPGVRFH